MVRARFALEVPLALAISVPEFAALRRVRPRPMGLAPVPPGWLRILGTHGWGPGLTDLSLVYGYPLRLDQPMVSVGTCFSEADCELISLEQLLGRARVADKAVEQGDPDYGGPIFSPALPGQEAPPAPSAEVERAERAVLVDGGSRTVTVASWREYRALRFRQDETVVTAVARHDFPAGLSFGWVEDLEPYFAGRRRFFLSWLR
jgi:hypothetical protein